MVGHTKATRQALTVDLRLLCWALITVTCFTFWLEEVAQQEEHNLVSQDWEDFLAGDIRLQMDALVPVIRGLAVADTVRYP